MTSCGDFSTISAAFKILRKYISVNMFNNLNNGAHGAKTVVFNVLYLGLLILVGLFASVVKILFSPPTT